MTKIAQKKAKNIKKLLEKPKISTPVKKISTDGVSRFFHLWKGSKFRLIDQLFMINVDLNVIKEYLSITLFSYKIGFLKK